MPSLIYICSGAGQKNNALIYIYIYIYNKLHLLVTISGRLLIIVVKLVQSFTLS